MKPLWEWRKKNKEIFWLLRTLVNLMNAASLQEAGEIK